MFKLGQNWLEELKDKEGFTDSASALRKGFWKAFAISCAVVFLIGIYTVQTGQVTSNSHQFIRFSAIIVALTVALVHGGWRIEPYRNSTIVERIDRGI